MSDEKFEIETKSMREQQERILVTIDKLKAEGRLPDPRFLNELLVKELRSGNYTKAKNALHKVVATEQGYQDHYCVMGVAIQVARSQGVPIQDNSAEYEGIPGTHDVAYWLTDQDMDLDDAEMAPPEALGAIFGWSTPIPRFETDAVNGAEGWEDYSAIYLNDSTDMSFEELADLFEREYLERG